MERRILKRIVFINIANSDYSSVEIAGNTCFVGTNNMGKTTLQRAILFFYNANSRGLGIAGSERPFEDYYFQFPNSYIIYEVETEEGDYHVLVYRNNKINYRFVECPFEKDIYIKNQEAISLKEILSVMNEKGIQYSDQVETFEKYRNIIYGTDTDKRYKRFALLKGNHQYQNIPLAISSIFLSYQSVVKAEFVKDCIANSINAKNTSIELKTVERQLRQFTEKYQDIEMFFKKENVQKAELIKNNLSLLKKLREGQKHLAFELGGALKYAELQKSEIEEIVIQKRGEVEALGKTFEKKEEEYKAKQSQLDELMGIVKNNLQEKDRRWKKYEGKNIAQLMEQSDKKEDARIELKSAEDSYAVLSSGFMDVEQTFKTLFSQLENEKRALENSLSSRVVETEKKFNLERNSLNELYKSELDLLKDKYDLEIDSYKSSKHKIELELTKVQQEEKLIRSKRYFESEITAIKFKIDELAKLKDKRNSALSISNNAITQLGKEAKLVETNFKIRIKNETERNHSAIQEINAKIEKIQGKLKIHKETFFGYLNEHKPDWFDTIGKVCSEEILFSKNLNPVLDKKVNDSLYGIKIDLSEIKIASKTVEQYEREKIDLDDKINELNKLFLDFKEQNSKEEQEELSAISKKTSDHKKNIQKLEYELELDKTKEQAYFLDLKEWEQNAKVELENLLLDNFELEKRLKNDISGINYQLSETLHKKAEEIKLKDQQNQAKISALKTGYDAAVLALDAERKEFTKRLTQKSEELKAEKNQLLKDKNIDTKKLDQLRQQIDLCKKKLKSIDDHADLVTEFKIDKRDYFDKAEDFIELRDTYLKELEQLKQLYLNQRTDFQKEEKKLKVEIAKRDQDLQKFARGLLHFENHFKGRPLYDRLSRYIDDENNIHSFGDIVDLCSRITATDNEYHQQFNHFKTNIVEYIGRFRHDNHFGFKIGNETDFGYENFANYLHDFLNENKIQISIAEVAKNHGMLIDTIATKVKSLTDQKGKINKIIGKMESDFSKAEFESSRLIEFIKLKTEDSENKVLKKLQKIFDFRESNEFMYGEANLFTKDKKTKNEIDRKSVELLYELQKAINEEQYDEIRVQDLFELRFRVKENKNDTGWVEKIEKVGSTGTDILVKAIIYITLLNVFIKESTEKTGQNFKVHCIIDEVGQISAPYLKELINFAESRNIHLINGLPNESKLETFYNYTYKFKKFENGSVRVIPLLTVSVDV